MKVMFDRVSLMKAFHIVAANVPARTPKDILKNVLLEVTSDGVSLCATDMETSIRCKVNNATASSRGNALLPTARISSILREMTDQNLELHIQDNGLTLHCSTGKFRLVSEDPAEFPPVTEFADKDFITVSGPRLMTMIRQTNFATDPDNSRYALGGVLFELSEGKLYLAGTDSRRLAVTSTAYGKVGQEQESQRLVVPIKACKLIASALSECEEVSMSMKHNSVSLKIGDVTIFSRVVEGRFPRWRDVIPTRFNKTVPLVGEPFASAIRQAMVVSNEEDRSVQMTFAEGSLTIQSATANGEANITLPIESDKEQVSLKLDGRYIGDFLKVLGSESLVYMNIVDEDTATLFECGESYKYVVMPLAKD